MYSEASSFSPAFLIAPFIYSYRKLLCTHYTTSRLFQNLCPLFSLASIEVDVKVKCIEQGKTQMQLVEEIDTTKVYVNRVIKKQDGVANKTYV